MVVPPRPIHFLLNQRRYSLNDCRAAVDGKSLPENLGNPNVRQCLVSGIRRHLAFAFFPEIDELCQFQGQELFARARNASFIMHNQLPGKDMLYNKLWHPYCIWYPRLASEETYRQLAAISPEMRYQIGRACVIGGYTRLYNELELLPDPSMAEEAREMRKGPAAEGAKLIYKQIMSAPVRYKVMNDYERTIDLDNPSPGAHLNADTAVFATLQQRFRPGNANRYEYTASSFDITEDGAWDKDNLNTGVATPRLTESDMALFESPLPFDLPAMRKDLLILVAAFEGNLDRYARLRRPGHAVDGELNCVIAGVYKSIAMANWLDRNPDIVALLQTQEVFGPAGPLRRAIHARRVMSNDVRHIRDANPPVPENELPYLIWRPTMPDEWTLETLADAIPAMRPQCAVACIVGNFRDTFVKILDMQDGNGNTLVVDEVLLYYARSSAHSDFFGTM
ncbi:hypothetical protein P171DRAFT_353558 [Karstenula rhodostoma CBS 690.94]|uniref:Uncharacterized protein n=1 Tax=Karstenula rhodostoma CBS 690.94 TaxID=1392251 RepID=A0A9P4UFG7_9PLEO|nr:hypothetical protein P171DRAFT_353558 [Karstenula rhodostoma CBS 690.94]